MVRVTRVWKVDLCLRRPTRCCTSLGPIFTSTVSASAAQSPGGSDGRMHTRYCQRMDHAWAAQQLREFLGKIDLLHAIDQALGEKYNDLVSSHGSPSDIVDQLEMLHPIMRDLMEAARPGLGGYTEPSDEGRTGSSLASGYSKYWDNPVR